MIFQHVSMAIGGITLFLLGLKFMSGSMEDIAGNKMKSLLKGLTGNRCLGVLTGAVSTAVIQSSIATNIILIGFVSSGIMTFFEASAVIMGANIGTTITAQLVSLSGKKVFDITAFGALIAFAGFIIGFIKNAKIKSIGNIMVGFGMIFLGLDIVNSSVNYFKNYQEFRNIFLVDSDFLLLLNGVLITSIAQSSSAVTSVMIILASNGLLDFGSAIFLTLGANIGTCVSVIISAIGKPVEARRTAFFNFAFNLVGALILFFPLSIFKSEVCLAFQSFSSGVEREIANFHTLFNTFVTITLLPILKPFTKLVEIIIPENNVKTKKISAKNGKSTIKIINNAQSIKNTL